MMSKDVLKNAEPETKYICVIPDNEENLIEQIASCYSKLTDYLKLQGLQKINVVKQAVFIGACDKATYYRDKKVIIDNSSNFFKSFIPISVISQPPLNTSYIAFEFAIISDVSNKKIEVKTTGQCNYLLIQEKDYSQIIASGLGGEKEVTDIFSQSIEAFEQMQSILKAEKMDFSDIVRQWNFIEKIVCFSDSNQHYQIFNDVRSAFYSDSNFTNGYPAATGIGMETGGIVIDFIAVKGSQNLSVIPISSPVQSNAHQYSKDVLAQNLLTKSMKVTTPKFERAKAVMIENNCLVYISGTAAIKGEFSVGSSDTENQTVFTLDSIYKLVTKENLQKHDISTLSDLIPCYFRVYIKNPSDYPAIKSVCDKYLDNIKIVYIQADICRPELLVEIEGVFSTAK